MLGTTLQWQNTDGGCPTQLRAGIGFNLSVAYERYERPVDCGDALCLNRRRSAWWQIDVWHQQTEAGVSGIDCGDKRHTDDGSDVFDLYCADGVGAEALGFVRVLIDQDGRSVHSERAKAEGKIRDGQATTRKVKLVWRLRRLLSLSRRCLLSGG